MCFLVAQVRSATLNDVVLVATDAYLYHHTKVTAASRFHMLSKGQLLRYLAEGVPLKTGGLPPHCTTAVLSQVAEALGEDYYRFGICSDWLLRRTHGCVLLCMISYYKNIMNKLRFDVRTAMEKLEPLFFAQPKPRAKSTRGRDKLRWYADTNEIAQVRAPV